jgi:glycosyltransferase involved in cell wall biosynthesis
MLADRLVGKLASRIIVHSKFLECELTERERWPYEKVVHIPLGISVEDFLEVSDARINNLRAEIGIPKSKTIVGLNARPVSYKGITYFIESARHLAKKDSSLHFLLINMQDSELKRNLCNLVAGYPITFIETVSDLPAFYKLIQVFCHVPTSREAEPAGFVYLEAIAAGVPSVFTISGLLPEIDLHDMPISIIDYRSSEQLSQAILVRLKENWVLQDSERRVRLTNFTLLKFLEAHKILYSNL